jgi:hypothetical protein
VKQIRSRRRSRLSTARCSRQLRGKTIILGVLDLSTHEIETAGDRGGAHQAGAAVRGAGERRRGAGLRSEVSAARRGAGKMRAMVAGARIMRQELAET